MSLVEKKMQLVTTFSYNARSDLIPISIYLTAGENVRFVNILKNFLEYLKAERNYRTEEFEKQEITHTSEGKSAMDLIFSTEDAFFSILEHGSVSKFEISAVELCFPLLIGVSF